MRKIFLNKYGKIHIVGIGGFGMSGIARILNEYGFQISGSDLRKSSITESLEKLGVEIHYKHSKKNIEGKDLIIYSSAVSGDNPEIIGAEELGIPQVKRDSILRELSLLGNCIAVAGSHGKTTTTGMIGKILMEADLDPTILIGGNLPFLSGANARLGKGGVVLLEADEYDRAFLQITPDLIVITNVEAEHLDVYNDFEGVKKAFVEFANTAPFYGEVFVDITNKGVREILPLIDSKVVTYGISNEVDVQAFNYKVRGGITSFGVKYFGQNFGEFNLKLHGEHNIKNALAAIALASRLGIKIETIKKALGEFTGANRRFEILRREKPVIIDDYAHHPTEIAATLKTAKTLKEGRIVAVFQPHLFSRTKIFYKEFAKALTLADAVVLLEIYPARENPIPGITSELIYNELKNNGFENVLYFKDDKEIVQKLNNLLIENDILIGLGAGDITFYIHQLADLFNVKEQALNG